MFVLSLVLVGFSCQMQSPILPESKLEDITWLNQSKQIKYPTKNGTWTGWVLLPKSRTIIQRSMLIFNKHPTQSEWKDCVEKHKLPDTMFISVTPDSKPLGLQYLQQQPTTNIQSLNC